MVTSLCEAEAKEKQVGILEVCKKKFKLTPLKLQTVRPFVFKSLRLSECSLPAMDSTINSVSVLHSYYRLYIIDILEFAQRR